MATPRRDRGEGRATRLSSRRSPPRDDGSQLSSASDTSTTAPDPLADPGHQVELVVDRPREGYDIDLFFDPDQKYLCPICMMVLRDASQTNCGHRFCQDCIKWWVRKNRYPQCPTCKDPCSRSQIFPDNFAKREVMSLQAKCPHHKAGCGHVMELRHLERHESDCVYAPVTCPKGCSDLVRRGKLTDHIQNYCTHRNVSCSHCNSPIRHMHLKDHEDECPEKVVDCEFCAKRCPRSQMRQHVDTICTNAPIKCYYNLFGCQTTFCRSQEDEHMRDCVHVHLFLLSRHLEMGTTKLYDVTRSDPITSVLPSVTSTLGSTTTDPGFYSAGTSMVYSHAHSRQPIAHSQQFYDETSSDLIHPQLGLLPGRITYPISSPPSPYGSQHLAPGVTLSRPLTFPLEPERQKMEQERDKIINDLRADVERQERLMVEQRSIIRHLQDMEGRMCNGLYVWKIRDYQRRKREAEDMKTIVHHSPGFYTSFYGYRMCIRVNLNGVESGKGTHLSLFVHLMQGEYDEILHWPFHGRIMLSVLDQRDNRDTKRDITETLIAKPGLAAFLKPTAKRNHKGFGYIEFAPLSYVENGQYIKNDTMIVKALVKPDD